MNRFQLEHLLADKGYDKEIYKLHHLEENTFLHLKRGGTLLPAMQKTCPLSLPHCRFVALRYGYPSRDATV